MTSPRRFVASWTSPDTRPAHDKDQEPAITVTTTSLTRAAGVSAAAAGAIFIGVQIGHPQLDLTSITTTNVLIRDSLKVLMTGLAVAGITGMYLSQVRRNGRPPPCRPRPASSPPQSDDYSFAEAGRLPADSPLRPSPPGTPNGASASGSALMNTVRTTYAIRVDGHLDDHWSAWLGELDMTRDGDGTTTVTVSVAPRHAGRARLGPRSRLHRPRLRHRRRV